jgi:ribonuclease P/MRP protein subunit POP1
MDSLRRKILGRSLPKRGKDRRELRSDVLSRRQSELCVLETLGPVSSAYDFRRQKMARDAFVACKANAHGKHVGLSIGGYLLPAPFPLTETSTQAIQPTEKSFRPSHRASVHGSILHDASYFGLIELQGTQLVLCRALEICCNPVGAGPTSKRCMFY